MEELKIMVQDDIRRLEEAIKTGQPEDIVDILSFIEYKTSSFTTEELEKLAEKLIEILGARKGVATKKAESMLKSLYPHVKEKIISHLWSDIPFVRNSVLEIIAYHRDRETVRKLTKDKDQDIRKFGIDIAFKIGDTEILRQTIDDEDLNVAISSAEYLAGLGDRSSIERIVDRLSKIPEDDIWSKLFILEALLKLEYQGTVELVKKHFKDLSDSLIRKYYIKACGVSGNKEYLSELINILKNEKSDKKEVLNSLIILLRSISLSPSEKERLNEALRQIIKDLGVEELELVQEIYSLL